MSYSLLECLLVPMALWETVVSLLPPFWVFTVLHVLEYPQPQPQLLLELLLLHHFHTIHHNYDDDRGHGPTSKHIHFHTLQRHNHHCHYSVVSNTRTGVVTTPTCNSSSKVASLGIGQNAVAWISVLWSHSFYNLVLLDD